jgi:phosphohistidine phosphatase
MKTLTIVRHAKAERLEGYATDFERPLTERGLKDSQRIGEVIARLDPPMDWLFSSPAARTRQTAERIAHTCDYTNKIQWAPEIYEASADTLLALLAKAPQDIQHIVLIGHNPGVADLTSGLLAGAPGRLSIHMPTAALAHLHLEVFWWNQIRWGCGVLKQLVTPKILKK